jgi:hypothetical protein
MDTLSSDLVGGFVAARNHFSALLYTRAVALTEDENCRSQVIPCLRREMPECLDTIETISKEMAIHSSRHPYVLKSPKGFHSTTVPLACALLKAHISKLADKLRDNGSPDSLFDIAIELHEIGAKLPF